MGNIKRKIKSAGRKGGVILASAALAFGLLATGSQFEKRKIPGDIQAAELMDSTSSVNYSSVLGEAANYGILAGSLEQGAHMESTFAVKTYKNSAENTDIDMAGEAPAGFIVGKIDSTGNNQLVIGKGTASRYRVETTEETKDAIVTARNDWNRSDATVYWKLKDQDAVNADVELMISFISASSKRLTDATDSKGIKLSQNNFQPERAFDFSDKKYQGKVVYVDITDVADSLTGDGNIKIKKWSDSVIVLTDRNASVNIANPKVTVVDKPEFGEMDGGTAPGYPNPTKDAEIAQKLILNLPNAEVVNLSNVTALTLAPQKKSQG